MNKDIIKGNWHQLKGRIKEEWGDLTDDELLEAQGEVERLSGVIQEKYGITKDEAEKRVDSFVEKHS